MKIHEIVDGDLELVRDGDREASFDIFIMGEKAGSLTVIGPPGARFIDLVMLRPGFQRQGRGERFYDAVEREIGEPLVPSPLGLSEPVIKIWKRRLAKLPADEVEAMLDRARAVGMTYGVRPQHIDDRFAPLRNRYPDL